MSNNTCRAASMQHAAPASAHDLLGAHQRPTLKTIPVQARLMVRKKGLWLPFVAQPRGSSGLSIEPSQ
eukprot:8702986-Pyramimonas_sp.AAC.1